MIKLNIFRPIVRGCLCGTLGPAGRWITCGPPSCIMSMEGDTSGPGLSGINVISNSCPVPDTLSTSLPGIFAVRLWSGLRYLGTMIRSADTWTSGGLWCPPGRAWGASSTLTTSRTRPPAEVTCCGRRTSPLRCRPAICLAKGQGRRNAVLLLIEF